ncbi:TrbI/VirB10 family protein [Asticcacaulis endophyticus]|nr:TrbI/VirB10 family protein [Asticcacaulis endophyticus]
MRLSRKALAGLGLVAGLGVGAAVIVALKDQAAKPSQSQKSPAPTQTKTQSEKLAGLPKDYSEIPQLGAPLPGDLGGPILAARSQGKEVAPPVMANGNTSTLDGPDAQRRQRVDQEHDAAISSQIFARGTATAAQSQDAATPVYVPPLPVSDLASHPLSRVVPAIATAQDRQVAFLSQTTDKRVVSEERLVNPPSPHILQAGSVIAAALITGIRSDLPGQVTAQVTQNVYDSLTGRYVVIPQGARLVGQYDNAVAFGQTRVLLVWTRLIFPTGQSIVLERQSAADGQGFAGLSDRTDYHWGGMVKAAALTSLLSVGAELASDDESTILKALKDGAQATFDKVGQQVVERQLNVQPTLTVRPGHPVRIILTKDLILAPQEP